MKNHTIFCCNDDIHIFSQKNYFNVSLNILLEHCGLLEIPGNEEKNQKNSKQSEFRLLLSEWNLSQYADVFDKYGYDMIDDWKHLSFQRLENKFGMKLGHVERFIRNRNQYFNHKHTFQLLSLAYIHPSLLTSFCNFLLCFFLENIVTKCY